MWMSWRGLFCEVWPGCVNGWEGLGRHLWNPRVCPHATVPYPTSHIYTVAALPDSPFQEQRGILRWRMYGERKQSVRGQGDRGIGRRKEAARWRDG